MSRRIHIAAVTVAAMASVALSGCTGGGSTAPGGGAAPLSLSVGSLSDNNSWDLADLEIGNRTAYWQPIYDTLLVMSPGGEIEPNLATSWSYNDDNTVLTLQLREGVTFTDGAPFNGDAVKASIDHLREGTGQNNFMAADVEEVEVISDTEVALHLAQPNPALISYLTWVGGAMASPDAIEAGTLAEDPVGSGPYVLDQDASTPGSTYVYERNDDYWNQEAFPYDEFTIQVLTDPTARVNAVKSGQVDGALIVQQDAKDAESAGLTLNTLPINWSGLLIGDRDGEITPALGDVRVRQAINMALDRPALVDALMMGYGEPTDQVFNTGSEAFDESLEGYYAYDPDKAKALLAEAGYPDGFEVVMPLTPGGETGFALYQQQLADIGITVKSDLVAANEVITKYLSGEYSMFIMNLSSASAWQDIETWILPDAPWNMFDVEDPELTKLIDAAQNLVDDADRAAAFQKVGAWLVENAWFAPTLRPQNVFVSRDTIDVQMQAQNSVPSLRNFAPAS